MAAPWIRTTMTGFGTGTGCIETPRVTHGTMAVAVVIMAAAVVIMVARTAAMGAMEVDMKAGMMAGATAAAATVAAATAVVADNLFTSYAHFFISIVFLDRLNNTVHFA